MEERLGKGRLNLIGIRSGLGGRRV
jgi:hypothetical protein